MSISLACSPLTQPSLSMGCRQCANVCSHAEPELLCVAVGNPAICVNGQSTDGGAMAWNLAHQRHGSNELLLCECAFFPVLFVCAIQRVSGYEGMASVTLLAERAALYKSCGPARILSAATAITLAHS
nr:hypothetical transcript [Hymenolepis microstoma]